MAADRIVVLGTGGTIAGRGASAQDHVGYRAGEVAVGDLLAGIPVPAGLRVGMEQVAQVDSKDMEPGLWAALAARCAHWLAMADVRGIVITHGTDTLEETAYLLHRAVPADKPVVLTCAMRPATALSPDGPQNLADALLVAATEGARGVVAVCAGRVHGAVGLRKVHPYRLDPFTPGDAGVVAYVEDGQVRAVREWPGAAATALRLPAADWPWVEILTSHAGARGDQVDALVRAGVRGLVVAGTGNGTLHANLEAALLRAMEAGVEVLRTTRCAEGVVVPASGGRIPSTPLTAPQARVELSLQLLGA